jgi:hypothetical protein
MGKVRATASHTGFTRMGDVVGPASPNVPAGSLLRTGANARRLAAIWPYGPARSRAGPHSLELMKLTARAVRTFRPELFFVLVQKRDNSRGIA